MALRTIRSIRRAAFWAALFSSTMAWAYVPGKFYYQGHTHEKVIALTFDDGPGATTPQILALLKDHHIRATFFMLGDQVPMYPQIAKQVVADGHEVGNHTWSHFDFHKVKVHPSDVLIEELDKTEKAIEQAAGVHAAIVRMPHGYFNKTWLLPTLREKGYALVHWTFGTDWLLKKSPEQMASEYIHNAHPGAVFLFHDGGKHREKTLAALKMVIPALEQKGYRFEAAGDLFKD